MKRKIRKINWVLIIILAIGILCCIVACKQASPDTDLPVEKDTDTSIQTPEEITRPKHQDLTIICNDSNKDYIEYLISSFTDKYDDVDIDIIYVEGVQGTDYSKKLSSLILAGSAPDIMIFGRHISNSDVDIIKSDVLMDINRLNEKYGYFDWSDYEANVINAGIFEGQRKFLPVYYDFPLLIGIGETLAEYNIEYGIETTFSEFVDSTVSFDGLVFRQLLSSLYMYQYVGLDAIDAYNGMVNLKTPTFTEFVTTFDALFPGMYSDQLTAYMLQGNYQNPNLDPLLAEDVLFMNASMQYSGANFSYISVFDSVCSDIIDAGKTPVLTAVPTMTGDGTVTGMLGTTLAISSATNSEEAALRLLAHATSFEVYDDDQKFRGIPINRQYNEAVKAMYYGDEILLPDGYETRDFVYSYDNLGSPILDQYYDLLSRVTFRTYTDIATLYNVDSIFIDIQKNGMEIDQAIAKAQNAIEIYINE